MLRGLQRTSFPFNQRFSPSWKPSFSRFLSGGDQKTVSEDELKIGDEVNDFKLLQKTLIPSRNITAYRLCHERTGAEHLHLACDDTNNVFSATFKTCPMDSRGVSHILEHTALCGSNKYPVRDPFFNMLKRSLNTYMNAWTAADYTMYPFSTLNEKDYSNLLDVYLDATFHPLLNELDFMQEGHRLEIDKNDSLVRKGVVYNEMKGAMADASSQFYHRMQEELHPSSTYHYNSGGEPKDIPKLTYEDFRMFHQDNYHPSNSFFYSYGSFPLGSTLEKVNSFLKGFEKSEPNTEVKLAERINSPKYVRDVCIPSPGDDLDRQVRVGRAYLLSDITDTYETFCLSILSSLLMNGPNSPFYQALIVPNIGSDFVSNSGYHNHTRDTSFCIGLQGLHSSDVERVLSLIDQTFEKVAEEGFPQERIDSLFHQIEFDQKHVTGNFGLGVGSGIMSGWIHGANPINLLQIDDHLSRIKSDLENDSLFFCKMVSKYFLENSHCVTLELSPDEGYVAREEEREKKELKDIETRLTEEEVKEIKKKGIALEERQNTKDDPNCLPSLDLGDVSQDIQETKLTHTQIKTKTKTIPLQLCAQPTNGIVYISGIADILSLSSSSSSSSSSSLSSSLLPYIPLYCLVVGRSGAGERNYLELAQALEEKSGGVSFSPFVSSHPEDQSKVRMGIKVSGSALLRNSEDFLSLLSDMILEPKFDDLQLLYSLLMQKLSDKEDALIHGGHSFAMSRARSGISDIGAVEDLWFGLPQLRLLQQLSKDPSPDSLEELKCKFDEISKFLVNAASEWAVNAQSEDLPSIQSQLESSLFSSFPSSSSPLDPTSPFGELKLPESISKRAKEKNKIYVPIPSPVSFVARSLHPSLSTTHPDIPPLVLLSKIASSSHLHKEVREIGGAYGSGLSVSPSSLSFYSYRDPNQQQTLDIFRKCGEWALSPSSFDERDLMEAQLRFFADLDSPISPSARGSAFFQSRYSDEMKREKRKRVFDAKESDLRRVASLYLGEEGERGEGEGEGEGRNVCEVILGPEHSISDLGEDWFVERD